jgi:biotin carboxyl carrier protein
MRSPLLLVVAAAALASAGCSKSESAQARGRESAAKPIAVETVRLEKVRRVVELVGTLAAVDQVTISSEADGKVSRILADLGDRVAAGQPVMTLEAMKMQHVHAAGIAGTVSAIDVAEGEQVAMGKIVVEIEAVQS